MTVDDAGDDVGEVTERIDTKQLAGFDQRGDDRPVLSAAIRAGEQGVLAVERQRANGALDYVVVDFDAAVVEKEAEPAQRTRA